MSMTKETDLKRKVSATIGVRSRVWDKILSTEGPGKVEPLDVDVIPVYRKILQEILTFK